MKKYLKVEGSLGLVRDPVSGAILNINNNEILKAKERKKLKQQEQEKASLLASEVEDLKNDVNEIKNLLKKLLEVNNGNNAS